MSTNSRPLSVSIISWFYIVFGGAFGFFGIMMGFYNHTIKDAMIKLPMPMLLQYVMMAAAVLVSVIGGAMMLQGKNWARMLFVVWGILSTLIDLLVMPNKLAQMFNVAVIAVLCFFLFRPKVNQFFTQTDTGYEN